jgi:hypothetical protein
VRKILLFVLMVVVVFGAAGFGLAQDEMKPLVTVSFAGYDQLKANIGVIGRLGGNPKLADGLEQMLQAATKGKGLVGIDAKRPWGAVSYLQFGGESEQPSGSTYVFIPVTDLKQVIETLKGIPRVGEITQDNGVYQVTLSGAPLLVQQKGQWAVVTAADPLRNSLANAPSDPQKLFGDMATKHDLAIRLSVKNVPEPLRQMFLSRLELISAIQGAQNSGESDAEFTGRKLGTEGALQAFTRLVNDLDEVLLGWSIDASTNKAHLDLEFTAKAGTKMAAQFAEMKPGKTKFAGVQMPGAALTINKTVTLSDADVAWAKSVLAVARKAFTAEMESQRLPADQTKLAKEMGNDLFDTLQKTIAAKKSDGGLVVLLDPTALTLVAGGQIVDSGKLEGILKKIIAADPNAAKQITLDADKHEGVRFHKIAVPTKDPKLVPLVGETMEIILGIADDRVFVAVGRNAAETLKKVIDGSKAGADKEVPPFELKLSLGRIVKFIAAVADDDMVKMKVAIAAGLVSQAGDSDHIIVTGSPIPQGVRVRVEIEQGLLKAISPILQMAIGVGPPPPAKNAPAKNAPVRK